MLAVSSETPNLRCSFVGTKSASLVHSSVLMHTSTPRDVNHSYSMSHTRVLSGILFASDTRCCLSGILRSVRLVLGAFLLLDLTTLSSPVTRMVSR